MGSANKAQSIGSASDAKPKKIKHIKDLPIDESTNIKDTPFANQADEEGQNEIALTQEVEAVAMGSANKAQSIGSASDAKPKKIKHIKDLPVDESTNIKDTPFANQ